MVTQLPRLRQDIRLLQGACDEQGIPQWMLFDPISNQYFQLSHQALPIIRHWQANMDISEFIQTLPQPDEYDPQDIQGFIQFLSQNHLIQHTSTESVQQLNAQYQQRQHHWLYWLIHNYLFIKVPLLTPNDLLDWLYPKVSFIFHPNTRKIILIFGIVGIGLTVHQWDQFIATFLHFFTWQGLLLYGITLAGVKIAHELGHALVSKKHHIRVSSMGVAFLVLFPVLYTDTTDAWRLKSKAQRLDIVTAGIRVELYLALIATFLWNFLPDGSLKSAAFFIATTSWITSLMINLSPFLRFDGYYAFSDALGVENLQQRSFTLAKWHLRNTLFGSQAPIPEPLTPNRQRTFILYAYSTWIYRFFLFLGIALLVYYFAFKLLGIILFLIEIIYFILLPIGKELLAWWQMKTTLTLNRNSLTTLTLLILMIVALITPWQKSITLPAILKAQDYHRLYSKQPAQINQILVQIGDHVTQGQPLIQLQDPQLADKILISETRIRILSEHLDRIASSKEARDNQQTIEAQLASEQRTLNGLKTQQQALHIIAPTEGILIDMQPLSPGQYINPQTPLAVIINHDRYQLIAYVPAQHLSSIPPNAKAQFISQTGEKLAQTFTLSHISPTAITELSYPELASDYQGQIATRMDKQHQRLIPTQAHYAITFTPTEPIIDPQVLRWIGQVSIEAQPISYLQQLWQTGVSVFIRESGF